MAFKKYQTGDRKVYKKTKTKIFEKYNERVYGIYDTEKNSMSIALTGNRTRGNCLEGNYVTTTLLALKNFLIIYYGLNILVQVLFILLCSILF